MKINFEDFYKKSTGYEFLIASLNIFEAKRLEIDKLINSENFEDETGLGMDKFNLLLINLAIVLELSLKGCYVLRKYNIFEIENHGIEKIEKIPRNMMVEKTFGLEKLLLEDNLIKILLDESIIDKYICSFRYLQKNRNRFVHFAEISKKVNEHPEKEHLVFIKDFFENYVRCFKDEAAKSSQNPAGSNPAASAQ